MTTATAELFDPQLLRTLRAAPWRTIEKRFLGILVGSIALHIAFASFIAAQPMPATEAQLDALQDRVAKRITLPPLLPIPQLALPATVSKPSATTAPSKPVDHAGVAKAAVVRVIGSIGGTGAFSELLAGPADEIARALDGATSVRIVGLASAGPRGSATGQTATIETIGTEGAKAVSIGTRLEKIPTTAVPGILVLDDPDNIDPRVLQQFIAARRAAVQNCYERELHHNPGMKGGKVVLRMAIGTTGRVSDLRVEEDTLGSDAVTSCMTTLMKRWIFPVNPKDEVPLSVPFVFARAN